MRPLDGVRVVEAASMVLVPSAAAMLADFGADVVKIEPLEGDQNRHLHELPGMPVSDVQYAFLVDNRSKRGIAVDLKAADGRAILDRLVARADVFMTNYRRPALERLRLGWEHLSALNERLVYASATGFGETGPEADKPAYDTVVYWTRSGIEGTMFPLDDWLGPIPAGAGDHPSGVALFGAVMMALFARERTGRGARVSTSLLANGLWANATIVGAQLAGAQFFPKRRRRDAENFENVYYRTRDGRVLKLSLVNPAKVWPRLCTALGRAELARDPRFAEPEARRAHGQELIGILDGVFAEADAPDWQARFEAHDVPFAILPTYPEVAADAQAAAVGVFPALVHPTAGAIRTVDSPIAVDGVTKVPPRAAPEIGAHTVEILRELGYRPDEVESLLAGRVVAQSPLAQREEPA